MFPRQDQREDAERDVQDEDASPPESAHQETTEHRSEARGGRAHGRPPGDGAGPCGGVGERRGQEDERGRHEQRGGRSLHQPSDDQPCRTRRQGAGDRRDHECRQPCQEHGSGAQSARQGAGQEQQRGEGDQVSVDEPGRAAHAQAEVVADGGGGDVDDRDVESGHEERQHDRRERRQRSCSPGSPRIGCGHDDSYGSS